jgi:hypothetical protein
MSGPSTEATEMEIKGKFPLRRNLHLRANLGYLSVALYPSSRLLYRMLAWANSKISDCSLTETDIGWSLWLQSAAFEISAAEAQAIREKFEPLGLCIEVAIAIAMANNSQPRVVPP